MVVAFAVGTVGAEETLFSLAESHAEVVGRRVHGCAHVGHAPAARACKFGTEYVEAAVTRMPVRRKIEYRVAAEGGEHFVAGGVYPLAEVLERAAALFEIYAPDVAAAVAAGHIGSKVEPLSVRRHCRMRVARKCIACNLEFHRRAPFGIGTL